MRVMLRWGRAGTEYGLEVQGIRAALTVDGKTVWSGRRVQLATCTEVPPVILAELGRLLVQNISVGQL